MNLNATQLCHNKFGIGLKYWRIGADCKILNSSHRGQCLLPGIFCTIAVFSLYGEYIVRFFLQDGVFLPSDDGLDF